LQPPEDKGSEECLEKVMIQKIVSIYKVKERYDKLTDNVVAIHSATRKEPQCHCRLLNILFSDRFSEGSVQIGNVATGLNLMQTKHPTKNYFGKIYYVRHSLVQLL